LNAPLSADPRHTSFSLALGRVWLVFPLTAGLIIQSVDVTAIAALTFLDFVGRPTPTGAFIRSAERIDLIVGLFALIPFYVVHQILSAIFATLSVTILGRVSFWWMIAMVPVVAYQGAFPTFFETYFSTRGPHDRLIEFCVRTVVQLAVVIVCWPFVRGVRRPPIWVLMDNTRKGSAA
jgi:hypothetical protein